MKILEALKARLSSHAVFSKVRGVLTPAFLPANSKTIQEQESNAGLQLCLPTVKLRNRFLNPIFRLASSREVDYEKSSEAEIRQRAEDSMIEWADKFSLRVGIKPATLRKLLPRVVTMSELAKIQADLISKKLLKTTPEMSRMIIKNLAPSIAENLSGEVIAYAFQGGELPVVDTEDSGGKLGGGYDSSFHVTAIDPKVIHLGIMTPQEIGVHEGHHAINTLFRSLLDKEQRANALIEGLANNITSGSKCVLSLYGVDELPFIPSREMRTEIAGFLSDILRKLNNGESDDRLEPINLKDGGINIKVYRLSEKGKNDIAEIGKKYDEFMRLVNSDEDDAKEILANLVEVQLSRFCLAQGLHSFGSNFSLTMGADALAQLDQDAKEELQQTLRSSERAFRFAYDSAKEFTECHNSNFRLQIKMNTGTTPSKRDLIDYTFSPEEVFCNLAAISVDIDSLTIPRKKKKVLKARVLLYEHGLQYAQDNQKLRVAKQDINLVEQEYRLRAARARYIKTYYDILYFTQEHLQPLSSNIPELNNLLVEEKGSRSNVSSSERILDSYKLRSKEHQDCFAAFEKLHNLRNKIKAALLRNDFSSAPYKEYERLLLQEEEHLKAMKQLHETLDENCLDPRERVKDQTLIDGIKKRGELMRELNWKAFIPSLFRGWEQVF